MDVSSTVEADPVEPDDTRVVRVAGGIVEWRCVECSGWQPLTDDDCRACGTPRRALARARGRFPTADALVQPLGWARRLLAILVSLALPGGGHVVAGRVAAGLVRLLIVGLWMGTAALALVRTGAHLDVALPGGWSRAPMVVPVLLVGVMVLWLVGVVDTVRMTGRRRRGLLGGRGLVWLVVVVSVGLLAATVVDLGLIDPPMGWT